MHGRLVVNAGGFRNRCVVNVQVPQEREGEREREREIAAARLTIVRKKESG
jgi:hypothetical protein